MVKPLLAPSESCPAPNLRWSCGATGGKQSLDQADASQALVQVYGVKKPKTVLENQKQKVRKKLYKTERMKNSCWAHKECVCQHLWVTFGVRVSLCFYM